MTEALIPVEYQETLRVDCYRIERLVPGERCAQPALIPTPFEIGNIEYTGDYTR